MAFSMTDLPAAAALAALLGLGSCAPLPAPMEEMSAPTGGFAPMPASQVAALREGARRTDPGERVYVLWSVPVGRWGVRSELVWVAVVFWDERGVMGTVASDPLRVPGLRRGQPILDPVPAGSIVGAARLRDGKVVEERGPSRRVP